MSITGCRIHDDCLTCPLERCVYDGDGYGRIREGRVARYRKYREAYNEEKTIEAVAEKYGVSVRTIERALKEELKK